MSPQLARARPAAAATIPARPAATLRLQLHKDFDFDAAAALVPYFSALGVSHLFASPILAARAGSTHGYDVVDHSRVNPELGGEAGLQRLIANLRGHGMGLIVDIVPNHMAVGSDNPRWLDLLEWGPQSANARFFDVDWEVPDPALRHKVLAPVLAKPYGAALAAGEIRLCFDAGSGQFYFAYLSQRLPLAARDYAPLLRSAGAPLAGFAPDFRAALARAGRAARLAGLRDACAVLAEALREVPALQQQLDALLERYAGEHEPARARLHALLERQHFRLSWWRNAADQINWRRFFDINELAALRVQDTPVFEAVHATIFRLYAEGLIDGLRVDHVDGLAEPRAYCRRLRRRLLALRHERPPALRQIEPYIVVEKILGPRELLPRDWHVDGTSGYAFMNEAGALLHDAGGEAALQQLWQEISGGHGQFREEERRARRRVPLELFGADFAACAQALLALARADPSTRDWSLAALQRVLLELLVELPVYRTYADERGRSGEEQRLMQTVVDRARLACRPSERALLEQVDRWLGAPLRGGGAAQRLRRRAIARFQQLTPRIAAKAVEDTAFYRHGRLLSRNEVGANPDEFSLSVPQFHRACRQRRRRYPYAMLATATHDHKRGEDARARLAVLSEQPQPWREAVERWRTAHRHHSGRECPDAIDEYLFYQVLTASWPPALRPDDADGLAAFSERLLAWQQKALREAKRRSSWSEPDEVYETGCADFVRRLLAPAGQFAVEAAAFVGRIAPAGAVKSLAQTLLKLTTPGVPDTYQGSEFWDFSLVDPDNRRPVDFAARSKALAAAAPGAELLAQWRDGRIKQHLIARALALRQRNPQLFTLGSYIPLRISGEDSGRLLAFARLEREQAAIVVTPVLPVTLMNDTNDLRLRPQALRALTLHLPAALRKRRWRHVLNGADCETASLQRLLAEWPVALLATQD